MYDVVVWAAVSTQEQAEKASIDHQLKLAQEWIEKNHARKVGELVVPGHTRDYIFLHEIMRDVPAYAQLVEMVTGTKQHPGKMFNLLLAYDHTRLARSEALLAQVREFLGANHIQIAYTTQFMPLVPPDEFDYRQAFSAKALSAIQGIATAQEMSTFRARARFGKQSKAEKGFWMGTKPPFGFRKVSKGVLEPDPEEAALIRRMYDMYLHQGLGYRTIAGRLNEEGYRTRNGSVWHTAGVYNTMNHPALIGKVVYGAKRSVKVPSGDGLAMVRKVVRGDPIIRSAHEAIVSEQDFVHLQDESKRRFVMRRGADVTSERVNLFGGILRCDYCGGPMGVHWRTKQHLMYYECSRYTRSRVCQCNCVSGRKVEKRVEDILREVVLGADLDSHTEYYVSQHDPTAALESVSAELQTVGAKIKRLEDAYLDGAIGLSSYKERQAELGGRIAELKALQSSLEQTEHRSARKTKLIAMLTELLTAPGPLQLPPAQLKIVYRELFQEIRVRDGGVVSWVVRP